MENQTESAFMVKFMRLKTNDYKCNFYANFRDKLELLGLISDKSMTIQALSEKTGISSRSIHRQIRHLKANGWTFSRNEYAQYRITGVPADFSELVTNLFQMIHIINRSN